MDKDKKNMGQQRILTVKKTKEEIAKKRHDELYEKAWLSRDQKPDTEYSRNTTTWD